MTIVYDPYIVGGTYHRGQFIHLRTSYMKKELVHDFLENEVSRLTYEDCDPERLLCVTRLLRKLDETPDWRNFAIFFDTASKDFLEEMAGEMEKLNCELKIAEDEAAKADPEIVVLTKSEATAMLRAQTIPNDKVLMVRGYGAHGCEPEDFHLWGGVGQDDLASYQDGSDPFQGYEDRDFQLWRK